MEAIDKIIHPIRPQLQDLIQNLPKPLLDISANAVGLKCHRSVVLELDLSNGNTECVKLVISKALGFAIVGASSIIKVPQLIKLLTSQSAEGLSFVSYLLETAAFVISLAYNLRQGFPFSTFGETAFIAAQDILISIFILLFSEETVGAAVFMAGLATAGYALFIPDAGLVDMALLSKLQAGAGVLATASKVPQILNIWSEGGTGQLSSIAVFGYLIGSVTRIFTTIQEVDDPLILYGFIAGAALNAILAMQFIYYWNSPNSNPNASKIHQIEEKNMQSFSIPDTPPATPASPAQATRSKGPSTRRRG